MNRIHEKALRLVYSDYSCNFDELLKKMYPSQSMIGISKRSLLKYTRFSHGLSPSIMKNIFQVNTNNPRSLKSRNELYCRNPKT